MAAIQRLFFDLPQATVEAIRDKAVALILEGKTVMQWSIGDSRFTKQFALSPEQMLAEANAALKHLDGTRVTTTYATFGGTYR